MYPNDFHVDIEYDVKLEDLNFWKKYQIVHYHRTIGNDYDKTPEFILPILMIIGYQQKNTQYNN
jgi:hypothetical protein